MLCDRNVMPYINNVTPYNANVMLCNGNVMPYINNVTPCNANVTPYNANVIPYNANVTPYNRIAAPHNRFAIANRPKAASYSGTITWRRRCPNWQKAGECSQVPE